MPPNPGVWTLRLRLEDHRVFQDADPFDFDADDIARPRPAWGHFQEVIFSPFKGIRSLSGPIPCASACLRNAPRVIVA